MKLRPDSETAYRHFQLFNLRLEPSPVAVRDGPEAGSDKLIFVKDLPILPNAQTPTPPARNLFAWGQEDFCEEASYFLTSVENRLSSQFAAGKRQVVF